MKRGRRKRRRRGGRNRDGSAQEPSTRERGASPAASIGSVVEVEVNGNVAPEPEAEPADWEEAREAVVPPAIRGMSNEMLVTTATGEMTHETGDTPPSSRRRRRRRKRSRGEGAVGEAPFQKKETTPASQALIPAESMVARRNEAREAVPVSVLPPREAEHSAPAAAPASETRVPEAAGETNREAPAPREEPQGKKAPKRIAPKKAAVPKKKTKAAPRKAAIRKGATGKAPPRSRE